MGAGFTHVAVTGACAEVSVLNVSLPIDAYMLLYTHMSTCLCLTQGEFIKMGEIAVIALSSVSSDNDLLKMWSRTLQLPEDTLEKPLQEVTINGSVWKVFEERSRDTIWGDKQHARLIAAFHTSTSGNTWFVKGFGEDLFMTREKKKILSLIESMKFQTVEAK